LEDWVSECEKRGLTVKSEAGLEAVAAHHGVKSKPQVTPRPQFSSQLFVDAIANFIISTDQVFSQVFFFPLTLIFFFTSLLVS
jgi:hypothetical protein